MIAMIRQIYQRRNLVYELALKDLKVRYQKPVLGFFWLILSPFFNVFIFYIVFAVILKIKIEEAPFVLYLMSAVFTWKFFQDSIIASVTSLVDNKNLIKEASFPCYLIPVSIVLANAVSFLPALGILIVTSLVVLKSLPLAIIFLPLIFILHLIITTACAIIFSILYVKSRDIKYALELVLLLLLYLTPAFYSISMVREAFSPLFFRIYISNPLVGILNLYRLSTLKGLQNYVLIFESIITPLILAVMTTALSVYLYKKNHKSINDYLSY